MNTQEIYEALDALRRAQDRLEEAYISNGGEATEETEAYEAEVEAIRSLITGDGVDSLGRWLKSKEDEKAAWKAEKAAADRRIKAVDKTIEYIKGTITHVMRETGIEKAKGKYYSFSAYDSTKTQVLTDMLDAEYLDLVTEAARNAGLPGCIDVALKTTATRLQSAEGMGDFVLTDTTPSVKFTKPRKAEED